MKKILYLIFTFLIFSFSSTSYANKVDVFSDGKTIKDLKKDIQNISKAENDLDSKYKLFLEEYKVDVFIKKWLNQTEIQNIKNIANNFLKEQWVLESKISNTKNEDEILKFQNSILDLRKNLYKSLIVYIEPKNHKNYLVFIETNIKNFVEKNTLQLSKIKTQNNYNKKVDVLEKKIQENKNNLKNEVKNIIEKKLDEKFSEIIDSPSFTRLSNESKIKVLENVIENLNSKIILFKSNMDYNWVYIESEKKKLEIYKIMVEKLREVASNLK